MERPAEGRNFRLLKDNELIELLEILTRYLPESLKFHQTLKTFLQYNVWKFSFYVAKHWPEDPICLHFPGVTTQENENFSSFSLFCPMDHAGCLSLLREEDIILDWSKNVYLNYIPSALMDRIELLYSDIGVVCDKCYGDFYWHSNSENLSSVSEFLGDDIRIQVLRKRDADLIHELYPGNDIECAELFEKLIEKLPSYGLYVGGELVAWILQSYYGAMFSMQTIHEFRRCGFGRNVTQFLTHLVRKRGFIPFVLIRSDNQISRELFMSLGFERLYENVRALLKPLSNI